ncbi:DUF5133 domain-containing protein [Kitasatospora sp. NPDC036755]|uniref:DUF5133 domain-containing protein n=1 Tax=Kitasatospora sp. NPDC036755 TaxID=3154600 RepID=UPI00340167B4
MPMVDVAALGRLVAEYEALSPSSSPEAGRRLRDVCYTIGIYTGEADAARAVARARLLLDRQSPAEGGAAAPGTPASDRARAALLAELGDLAARERTRSTPFPGLHEVVQQTRVTVPHCVGAAVSTWHDDGSVETFAATPSYLLALERAQGGAGEAGPLPRLRRQGEGQVVVRLDPGRPDRFGDRARRCGVRAVAGAHLRTHPHGCTVFSAYLRTPVEPGTPALGLIEVLALQASAALDRFALSRAVADLLDRRHATGLAIGITAERFDVTPHTALSLLVGAAQRLGTDLDTVARHLADGDRPPSGRTGTQPGP